MGYDAAMSAFLRATGRDGRKPGPLRLPTMDASRSRAFTVGGTLWLLYSFHQFDINVLNINSNRCTKSWPECGGFHFPESFAYFAEFALLCVVWISSFASIFVANNPFRPAPCSSRDRILPSFHPLGGYQMSARCKLQRKHACSAKLKIFEIGLIFILQNLMDASFLVVCLGKVLGWKTFPRLAGRKIRCLHFRCFESKGRTKQLSSRQAHINYMRATRGTSHSNDRAS